MNLKYTRHQVARGALPDLETRDRMILVKNVSELRATYQIRLLLFKAVSDNKKVEIRVPSRCKLHWDLKELRRELPASISIKKVI